MMRNMVLAVVAVLALLAGVLGTTSSAAGQTDGSGNLTGTLQAVSSTRIILATGGHTVELQITSATVIQVNGKSVGAGDLRVGMTALVITTDGRTATEIRAESAHTTSQPTTTGTLMTGLITQIGGGQLTFNAGDHLLTITLTATTVFRIDDKIVGVGDVKAGMTASIFFTEARAALQVNVITHGTTTSQPATRPTEQTGVITLISDGHLNLQASVHGLEFSYGNATVFKLDGKVVGVGDVKVGMSAVVLATEGHLATEVRAYSGHTTTTQPTTQPAAPVNGPTGYIRQIGEGKLTLETAIESMAFTITDGTVFKLDGKVVGIGDIKVGMPAMVIAGDGTTATEVRAYTPKVTTTNPPAPDGQTGTIAAAGDGKVTLQASAHTLTYTLTEKTVIKLDGKVVGPGELKAGLMAIVFSPDGTTATEVRAYTPPK